MTPADSIAHAVYWYKLKMDFMISGIMLLVIGVVALGVWCHRRMTAPVESREP